MNALTIFNKLPKYPTGSAITNWLLLKYPTGSAITNGLLLKYPTRSDDRAKWLIVERCSRALYFST
jgi:hypothetical protein